MTIGKKLYAGFGLILAILSVVRREYIRRVEGKSGARRRGKALDSVRTVESVRYQIMLNRLNMNNFLSAAIPAMKESE